MDLMEYLRMMNFLVFVRWMLTIGVIAAIIIYIKSSDTGDDPWVWCPFVILLPFIAIPIYILYSLKRRREDRVREFDQMQADKHRGGYISRRVTSEKDLVDDYHRGKARRR